MNIKDIGDVRQGNADTNGGKAHKTFFEPVLA